MAEKKITKRENFGMVRAIIAASNAANKAALLVFLDNEVALLDKKSGKAKETKTQVANGRIKTAIMAVLADMAKPVTISELLEDERLATYTEEDKNGVQVLKMSNQKLSAVMKMLVDANEVIKTEDKKKSYFSLPVAEAVAAVEVEVEEEDGEE